METTIMMMSETTEEGEGEGEASMLQEQEQQQMPPVLKEKKKLKVLVGIDESDFSFYALKWTLENLFIYADMVSTQVDEVVGTLILLHVQQPFQNYTFPAGPTVFTTTAMIEDVKRAQEKNSAMLLSRAIQVCKEAQKPVKIETIVMEGDPKEMICQTAEQIHPDLLIVGSRGLSKLKRAFLGSVSDYCAHHAKCPILIVKPPKEA